MDWIVRCVCGSTRGKDWNKRKHDDDDEVLCLEAFFGWIRTITNWNTKKEKKKKRETEKKEREIDHARPTPPIDPLFSFYFGPARLHTRAEVHGLFSIASGFSHFFLFLVLFSLLFFPFFFSLSYCNNNQRRMEKETKKIRNAYCWSEEWRVNLYTSLQTHERLREWEGGTGCCSHFPSSSGCRPSNWRSLRETTKNESIVTRPTIHTSL